MPTRRTLLKGLGTLACSVAAHPLMSTVTLAAAPWDSRLVVIILRGGMDGLDVVRPTGDPGYAALRSGFGQGGLPLQGLFSAHPALAPLMPLWAAGELGFAHAVSTPYRDKRSHFDGQDLLEAGTGMDVGAVRNGWLNRMLQTVPGLEAETAFAVGQDNLLVLKGDAPVAQWSPEVALEISGATKGLLEYISQGDPLFRDAVAEAVTLTEVIARDRAAQAGDPGAGDMMEMMQAPRRSPERALAAFAADRMNHDTRIAAFSITGWDTHRGQAGAMPGMLERLSDAILTLRSGLGRNWARTTVLAMTEFGRTAAANGSGGTDHGTGGVMVMAGGAVKGGRILGTWPGLAEADLYDRRDLMPTGDVRAYSAWAMAGMFGLNRDVLESAVFPGLEMGRDPGLLL